MDSADTFVNRVFMLLMGAIGVFASFSAGLSFVKVGVSNNIIGVGYSLVSALVLFKMIQKLGVVEYISKQRVYDETDFGALLDASHSRLKPGCFAVFYTFGLVVVSMAVLLTFHDHEKFSLEEFAKMREFINSSFAYFAVESVAFYAFYESLIYVNFKHYIKNNLIQNE